MYSGGAQCLKRVATRRPSIVNDQSHPGERKRRAPPGRTSSGKRLKRPNELRGFLHVEAVSGSAKTAALVRTRQLEMKLVVLDELRPYRQRLPDLGHPPHDVALA